MRATGTPASLWAPLPPSEHPGPAQPPLLGLERRTVGQDWVPREYFCESVIRQRGEGRVRGRNTFYRLQKSSTWVGRNC